MNKKSKSEIEHVSGLPTAASRPHNMGLLLKIFVPFFGLLLLVTCASISDSSGGGSSKEALKVAIEKEEMARRDAEDARKLAALKEECNASGKWNSIKKTYRQEIKREMYGAAVITSAECMNAMNDPVKNDELFDMNRKAVALESKSRSKTIETAERVHGTNLDSTLDPEVVACVQRGVEYFKSIDSYPTLKSYPNAGRSAEEVALRRCNTTLTAF